jgi:hypothetical protein
MHLLLFLVGNKIPITFTERLTAPVYSKNFTMLYINLMERTNKHVNMCMHISALWAILAIPTYQFLSHMLKNTFVYATAYLIGQNTSSSPAPDL